MVRTLVLSLVALMLSVSSCFAAVSGSVQYQTVIVDGLSTPRFVMTADLPVAHGFSWSFYAQTDRNWSEAYVGPAYTPTAWSQIGVGFGTEAYTKVIRKAAFIWVGHGSLSALAAVEGGGSARFTALSAMYSAKQFSAGYVYDTILGHGVKVSVKASKTYAAWVTAQDRGAKLTLQYGF
jgi:hypothetical protein